MRVFAFILLCLVSSSVLLGQEISLVDLNQVLKDGNHSELILIKDGTYSNVSISISGINNVVIKPRHSGAVTIKGKSSISILNSKKVTIEGFSFKQNKVQELIKIQNSPSCTITNNFFYENGSQRYGTVVMFKGISPNGKVSFNTFDANRAIGVAVLEGSTGADIRNNNFLNVPNVKTVYPNSDGNGMESIQIGRKGNWASNAIVQNNNFNNIVGDRAEIISIKSNHASILDNNFIDCHGGVTLRLSNSSIISGNTFQNVSNSIRVYGKDHVISNNFISNALIGIQLPSADENNTTVISGPIYWQSSNIIINNNKIVKTKVPITLGNGYSTKRAYLPKGIKINGNKFDKNDWITKNKSIKNLITDSNISNGNVTIPSSNKSFGKKW